jgi:hypothetical protein
VPTTVSKTQAGQHPAGYRNPSHLTPTRFNRWKRPAPVADMGRTPATMFVARNVRVLGAGQVRRLWRQTVNYIPAPPAYSWTANGPVHSGQAANGVGVTRALRYMTRSVYRQSGTQNTRLAGLHTHIPLQRPGAQNQAAGVTIKRGQTRSRPTVRNRMSSFGSRVPTLNQPVSGARDTP